MYDLIKNIKTILKNAIKAGGTTIKDHMQPDGSLGYFKQKLRVYGRSVVNVLCAKLQLKKSNNLEELVFIAEFVKDKDNKS